MRFLILNADYSNFLRWLYAQHPGLQNQPYEEQLQVRAESLFGVADFYSSNLRKLGHEAWDIRVNNEFIQKAWAKEHGIHIEEPTPQEQRVKAVLRYARYLSAQTPLSYLKPIFRPLLRPRDSQPLWCYKILAAQIKYYKPDVVLNQAMDSISGRFLQEMKPYIRLLVGQIAAPLPENENWSYYDLVISSLDNFVEYFRRHGMASERHRLGFEPKVLDKIGQIGLKSIAVSFVGGLSQAHPDRLSMFENLCRQVDLQIWAMVDQGLSVLLRQCYKGEAWGYDMYRILQNSKITLNLHGKWAGCYANNLRLYEATGVGTLLITDWKVNLHEMFEPGRELVAYRTPEECVELIKYYLKHDAEREAIARAGQERTLREHTYYQRMQELMAILHKYI